MNGFYISAAHKSSGKTTLTLGLSAALRARQLGVQSFKKGPDYIDPIWLQQATGRECYNLDFFTSSHREIQQTFNQCIQGLDVAVVEGNKGLFDGMDVHGSDSNAAMAKLLNLPVILVIDTVGMTRGIAPLLMGYRLFDSDVRFAGVILNRVGGERHEAKLRAAIETYTDFPVLGAVRRFPASGLVEEHLGLVPATERGGAAETIAALGAAVAEQVDLDAVLQATHYQPVEILRARGDAVAAQHRVRIGIARDAAFGFYYADDMAAFAAAGAELVPVNMLNDRELPELDGLFLGGGFPERHMDALAANVTMRESVKMAIEHGLPTYAECGGLMYLTEGIHWQGTQAPMAGVIPAETIVRQKPQGRGYTRLRETHCMPWGRSAQAVTTVNAHEFHYSELIGLPDENCFAYQVERGVGIKNGMDGYVYKNLLASYTHLRDSDQNHWVSRFTRFVRDCA